MAKGGVFEREVCKELSLWWSGGRDDNVFGRSHGSGGRGTSRAKRGLAAANQHGDVMAVDESGHALMRFVCLELKRGYNALSLQDLVDYNTPPAKNRPSWPAWVAQAERSRAACGAVNWAIIFRRDKRRAMIAAPLDFYAVAMNGTEASELDAAPSVSVTAGGLEVLAFTLFDFFLYARPDNIRGKKPKPKRKG